jgi:hypothetical protein
MPELTVELGFQWLGDASLGPTCTGLVRSILTDWLRYRTTYRQKQ